MALLTTSPMPASSLRVSCRRGNQKGPRSCQDKIRRTIRPKPFELPGEGNTFEVRFRWRPSSEHAYGDGQPYVLRLDGFPRFYSLWTPDHVGDPGIGSKILAAVTGIDRTMEDNVAAMEAAFTLERAIRAREGQRREHDCFSAPCLQRPNGPPGPNSTARWMTTTGRGDGTGHGYPTRSKLEKLGMKDVADELEIRHKVPVTP